MRWVLILINANLCCGIVIHLNPIKIISYKKSNSSDHAEEASGDRRSTWNVNPATKELEVKPLIPGTKVENYAGYFNVNEKYDSNLFFWFFASERDPEHDPLLVWLQGQPGASSLYGLFDENGPYRIEPRNRTIQSRPYSWTKIANVLYLDHCTDCGYSYTVRHQRDPSSLENVAKNIITALKKFFLLFPKLRANDIYLAGESMSGKYIFVTAHAMCRSRLFGNTNETIRGVIVGNGFMDALQIAYHNEYLFQMGVLDLQQHDDMNKIHGELYSKILSGRYEEAIECWMRKCYQKIKTHGGYHSMYDVRNTKAFWDSAVPDVVTSQTIRNLLRVNHTRFQPARNETYYVKDVMRPITHAIADVLQHCKVLFYSGQFDMLVPYTHTALFLDRLKWPGMKSYYTAPYEPWMMWKNLRYEYEVIKRKRTNLTEENTLVGYVKNSGNLHHVLILNSGHQTGVSQPQVLQQMVERFVSGNLTRSILTQEDNLDDENA